jgi:hypothetical protein
MPKVFSFRRDARVVAEWFRSPSLRKWIVCDYQTSDVYYASRVMIIEMDSDDTLQNGYLVASHGLDNGREQCLYMFRDAEDVRCGLEQIRADMRIVWESRRSRKGAGC